MRVPWPAVAGGVAVAAVGAAGLIRGAVPQSSAAPSDTSATSPIVVSGAYLRPPVPPTTNAAVYFTISNTTGKPDRLLDVQAAVGTDAVLHTSGMRVDPDGVTIPAHGRLTLSPGHGHVMIEGVTDRLAAGSQVNLILDFATAGAIDVPATVVPFGRPIPSGAPS